MLNPRNPYRALVDKGYTYYVWQKDGRWWFRSALFAAAGVCGADRAFSQLEHNLGRYQIHEIGTLSSLRLGETRSYTYPRGRTVFFEKIPDEES